MTSRTLSGPDGVRAPRGESTSPVLSLTDVALHFPKQYGPVSVLDKVNLTVRAGECVAIVGESGCGKSLLGLAAADLLPPSCEMSGTVAFLGKDVQRLPARARRSLHGAGIGVVYQDALTSLNPGMTVEAQLRQVCRGSADATPRLLLTKVGLSDTARILRAKPYQLSGGQRQRVLIAIALARRPNLIIADEPTTALDVTVQAQIIALLRELQSKLQFALLFISHDLALVSQIADRTAVMYSGQVVEFGPTREILSVPQHPYTAGLVAASVSMDRRTRRLLPIPGKVRQPLEFASGCRFRDRCESATDVCATNPKLEDLGGHQLACFHPVSQNFASGDKTSMMSGRQAS
jgi:oligopeptide/dipeptide ABC transporter ATP-binding protein